MNNKNEPAFPIQPTFDNEGRICNERYGLEGLTKREYFAGLAMQGFLSNSPDWSDSNESKNWAAKTSVEYADALLAELEKTI